MTVSKKIIPILLLALVFNKATAQQTPLNPLYYWVFSPYVYNPAMSGYKDFISIDMTSAFRGSSNTELLSGNARISKTESGYFSSPDIMKFRNMGLSGTIFHDVNGLSKNSGASLAGSYQIPIDTRQLTYLSFGASVKGVYNTMNSGTNENGTVYKSTFYPNADVGIYFYGAKFFTGISAVNLFGNPNKPDTLGRYAIPVARQYFFTIGYKIVLSSEYNVVLEPSFLVNSYDSNFKYIVRNIDPIVKLYVDNLCLGTYLFTGGTTAFFAKFKYPRFYLGAFFELPNKTPFYRKNPTVELTLGLNLQSNKSRLSKTSHW